MAPLVSVIIPTYNRAKTIARAIDSALAQTHEDLEVVVSDNGSTDGSEEILARYEQDPRVVIVRNPTNLGPIPNWTAAFDASRGSWIKVCWSDDWMDDNVVAGLLRAITESPDAAFSVCSQLIHLDDRELRVRGPAGELIRPADILRPGAFGSVLPVSPGAALMHRVDVEWALHDASHRLPDPCVSKAIGPDLLMLYGAFRRGRVGVHAGPEVRVHFDGRHDSITLREDNAVLSSCYRSAQDLLLSEVSGWVQRYVFPES
jgi:glycosyltransferase involved in cell wall biosynthesis